MTHVLEDGRPKLARRGKAGSLLLLGTPALLLLAVDGWSAWVVAESLGLWWAFLVGFGFTGAGLVSAYLYGVNVGLRHGKRIGGDEMMSRLLV